MDRHTPRFCFLCSQFSRVLRQQARQVEEADHPRWQWDDAFGIASVEFGGDDRYRLNVIRTDRKNVRHPFNDKSENLPWTSATTMALRSVG